MSRNTVAASELDPEELNIEAGKNSASPAASGRSPSTRSDAEPLWCVKEVARFLNVSVKTVRRMEARGELRRCRHLIGIVRFSPRDVRGLASAR